MEIPSLSLTESDAQVFLRGVPDVTCPELTAEHLRAWIADHGYADCQEVSGGLDAAAQECNQATRPFVVHVLQRCNAVVQVQVATDDMAAHVVITAPQGGQPASESDVLLVLREHGVVLGLDAEALRQACVTQPFDVPLRVAAGVVAQDGVDARFEPLIPEVIDRSPRTNADGLIDYREHGAIAVVAPGQLLMRRTPATPGVPGFTVRGIVLAQRQGVDAVFASGLTGVQASAEDPDVLTASGHGVPVRLPNGMQVEPVLQLDAVNMTTGNVYFDGTVCVGGEVAAGMKVQASGDVEVGGTVDGAQVQAGGSVVVKGGIIAHAQVHAGHSVRARFVENATIQAGQLISVDDTVLHSTLRSGAQVILGSKNPARARLVGGSTQVDQLLKVPWLGSDKAGSRTRVILGYNPELEARLEQVLERMQQEQQHEAKLDKLRQQLGRLGDPKGVLLKVLEAWKQVQCQWAASAQERDALQAQLLQLRSARLELGQATSGDVELQWGHLRLDLADVCGPGILRLDATGVPVHADRKGWETPLPKKP